MLKIDVNQEKKTAFDFMSSNSSFVLIIAVYN